MENRKGISLISLVITIIVMLILVSTVTISMFKVQENTNKSKFANEISFLQEISDSYKLRNGDFPVSTAKEVLLTNIKSKDLFQFDGETKIDNKISLFEIDRTLIGKTETIYGNKKYGETDIYMISKETGKVYYIKGLETSETIYYTLTDELKKIVGYVEKNNAILNDNIIITPSTTEYTNKKIITNIKIPKEYKESVVIKQKNTQDITLTVNVTNKNYNIYDVTSIENNYDIVISYTKPNSLDILNQIYSVKTFDKLAPIVNISSQKSISNENTKYAYFEIEGISDDLSGIKFAKYDIKKISENDAKLYFQKGGKSIQNNVIKVGEIIDYITIYVEDNAGNYFFKQVKIINPGYNEFSYIKKGLVLHYDGINNSGNDHSTIDTIWKDLSGNSNDGKLTGFTFDMNNGWNKESLKFGGTNQIVTSSKPSLTDFNSNNIDHTISIIFKTPIVVADVVLAGNGTYLNNGFYIQFKPNNKISINYNTKETSNGIITLDGEISNNKIIDICFVRKLNEVKLYINGEYKNKVANVVVPITTTTGYVLNQNSNFNGEIYKTMIYDRALTDEEIKYNNKIDRLRFDI